MKRAVKTVIFDWDGTIADSVSLIVEALQHGGYEIGVEINRDDARHIIGLGLAEAKKKILPEIQDNRTLEKFYVSYRRFYKDRAHEVRLFQGARELLKYLKPAYTLAVATGKSRSGLNQALRDSALDRVFFTTRTADETEGKPSPKMLHEILEETETGPEQALMIGDTVHDLAMAENAGVASIGVTFGAHDPVSFDRYRPLSVCGSMAELHDFFEAEIHPPG